MQKYTDETVDCMLNDTSTQDAIRPVFIIGAPRSGTSIMTWALGQHPNIQPMPETSWIATMTLGGYLSYEYGSSRGRFSHLSNVEYPLSQFMRRVGESIDRIVHDCFEERCRRMYGPRGAPVAGAPPGTEFQIRRSADEPKRRWIDGTPYNTPFAWALVQMFPEAVFIHNLRQPHEVVTSLEAFDNVGSNPQELEQGLATWRAHASMAWLVERALGSARVFRLDFGRIAGDAEALMQELCGFLDEPYSPACVLPLGQRINSSQVDHRYQENLARLQQLPNYQEARALYDEMIARPPTRQADDEAMERLRNHFVEHGRSHPLM
jgi:hypothetical protein